MRTLTATLFERPRWQQVLFVVLVSITYIHLSGLLGTTILVPAIGWGSGIQYAGEKANSIDGRFVRWDSGYYIQIAQEGYSIDGTEKHFFPLYPLLCSSISNVLGLPLLWSGLLVSFTCFAVGCLLLYQWVSIDYKSEIALWTVIWICVFPMSFFFVAFYAEALFLLVSIAGIYLARHGKFIASGLAITLAGATRPMAFLLAIPYIFEFWQKHDFGRAQVLRFILGALIAPLGMLGYLYSLVLQTGGFDILNVYYSHLSRLEGFTTWPWVTLHDGIRAALFGIDIASDWFSRALVWQDLTYAMLGLVFAVWALFHLRVSAALFLLGGVLFYYTQHGPNGYAFWSIPRYIAVLPPIYLILACLTVKLPNKLRWLLAATSIGLLGILSAWFASGRWVA